MNTRLVIAALVVGAVAFACAARPSRSESAALATASTRPATPTKRHGRKAAEVKLASNFGVQVDHHAAHFALDVTNAGTSGVEITFPSGQAYDFVVLDSVGRQVWHWAEGRMFTQALQNKLLSSGDTMRIAEDWNAAAAKGHYTAVARLRSSNFPLEQRVDFVVQ